MNTFKNSGQRGNSVKKSLSFILFYLLLLVFVVEISSMELVDKRDEGNLVVQKNTKNFPEMLQLQEDDDSSGEEENKKPKSFPEDYTNPVHPFEFNVHSSKDERTGWLVPDTYEKMDYIKEEKGWQLPFNIAFGVGPSDSFLDRWVLRDFFIQDSSIRQISPRNNNFIPIYNQAGPGKYRNRDLPFLPLGSPGSPVPHTHFVNGVD